MQQTNIENIIAYSQPQNRDNCSFKAQAGYPEVCKILIKNI